MACRTWSHGSVSGNRPMGPLWTATNEPRVRAWRTLQGVTLAFGKALFLRLLQQLLGLEFLSLLAAPAPASWYVHLHSFHLSLWSRPRALTYNSFQKYLNGFRLRANMVGFRHWGCGRLSGIAFANLWKWMREYIAWIVVCSSQNFISVVYSHQLSTRRLLFLHFTLLI